MNALMNATALPSRTKPLAAFAALIVGFALACMVALALGPADQAEAKTIYSTAKAPRAGATFTVDGNVYKVTDAYEGPREPGEVRLVKYGSKKTNPTINTVKYQGKLYEVEEIGKNAFNNARGHKVTSVKLGRNVDYIGARAFYGCNKVRTFDIAASDVVDIDYSRRTGRYSIDEVEIGYQAFTKAGVSKVTVKCGNAKVAYQKLVKKALSSKGLRSNARVVK